MNQQLITLLYRSFDEKLNPEEAARLQAGLAASSSLREEKARIERLRKIMARGASASFEVGFSQRVLQKLSPQIEEMTGNLEDFFFSFWWSFKRVALAGGLAIVVLLSVNLWLNQSLSVEALLNLPQLTLEDALYPEDLGLEETP